MRQIDFFEEMIIDNFAGGGGASTGIELATGRAVDAAINHDPDAILMHRTNHPQTRQGGIWWRRQRMSTTYWGCCWMRRTTPRYTASFGGKRKDG